MNYSSLILASKSSRRKDILKTAGIPFKVVDPKVDEKEYLSDTNNDPISIALELAKAKANDVAQDYGDYLVLAADTIVIFDNEVIGKPQSEDDAKIILNRLSGKSHKVVTAYNLLWKNNEVDIAKYAVTEVDLYPIETWEIDYYLKVEKYQDAAGAYKIQGSFAKFVKEIKGSYHNVMGLPIGDIYYNIKNILNL